MNSFLIEAVHQGQALKSCLDYYAHQGETELDGIVRLYRENNCSKVVLSGMGSSYYAAFSICDRMVKNKISTIVLTAYELAHYQLDLLTPDTLLVVISQSGKTKEGLELVEKARDRAQIVAMVNKEDSLLADAVEHRLWIKAGLETQITNKSFVNTVALLNLLAAKLEGDYQQTLNQLYGLSEWIDQYMQNMESNLIPQTDFVNGLNKIDLLADGPSYGAAMQGGLVFREGPKIFSTACTTADYAHGWDKAAQPGLVAVIHTPNYTLGTVDEKMIKSLTSKGARVILITAQSVPQMDVVNVVCHPSVPEPLAVIPQIIITSTLMGWLMGEKSDRE
jgi:glutamine---fructose-6-phosphate transaminase (isomerizing)